MMTSWILQLCTLSCFLMTTPPTYVHERMVQTRNINNSYIHFKLLYSFGQKETVMQQTALYVKDHPQDSDARLILSTFYMDHQQYMQARNELWAAVLESPQDVDASLMLIKLDMMLGSLQEAYDLISFNQVFHPLDPDLLKKHMDLERLIVSIHPPLRINAVPYIEPPHEKISHLIHRTHVDDTRKITKKSHPEPVKYLNEIGVSQQNYYISDVRSIWDYSTLFYGRDTPLGKMYGKINYASRLHHRAIQGEFEAFPKINKQVYLDLDVAFANEPHLFPDQSYAAETYVSPGNFFDFSLGGRYNKVDALHWFAVFTGSLAQDLDHHQNRITFRPYYFLPGRGSTSTLFTLDLRHIMLDPYHYIGCLIGAGSSPDLANLTTISFIVLQNKLISPYVGFALLHERLITKMSFLYQNQLFPGTRVRNWTGGTLNLTWKF